MSIPQQEIKIVNVNSKFQVQGFAALSEAIYNHFTRKDGLENLQALIERELTQDDIILALIKINDFFRNKTTGRLSEIKAYSSFSGEGRFDYMIVSSTVNYLQLVGMAEEYDGKYMLILS